MATVRDLIEYLYQFPEDSEVMISTYSCGQTYTYPYDLSRIQMHDRIGNDVIIEAEDN